MYIKCKFIFLKEWQFQKENTTKLLVHFQMFQKKKLNKLLMDNQFTRREMYHGDDSTPNPGNNFNKPLATFQFNGSS